MVINSISMKSQEDAAADKQGLRLSGHAAGATRQPGSPRSGTG